MGGHQGQRDVSAVARPVWRLLGGDGEKRRKSGRKKGKRRRETRSRHCEGWRTGCLRKKMRPDVHDARMVGMVEEQWAEDGGGERRPFRGTTAGWGGVDGAREGGGCDVHDIIM